MNATAQQMEILIFEIGDRRYGIPVSDVRELLRSVTVTPLPNAPAAVEGLINVRGALTAVLDLRKRLGLAAKPLDPGDHFVLVNAGVRTVVLRVDRAVDVLQMPPEDIEQVRKVALTESFLAGVAKLPDGLVLIHDLSRFLSAAEALELDTALAPADGAPVGP